MKPELQENLDKARSITTELDGILSRNKYHEDQCTLLVAGLLTTVIQYHHSIVLLINAGDVRAAAVLAQICTSHYG